MATNLKIGDKVRFLSETGGGKVAGFQGKNIVLVEDEDGFQIPTPINDVVLVSTDDYNISKVHTSESGVKLPDVDENGVEEDYDPADREITFRKKAEERKEGNKLSAYLAFVPHDEKMITNTRFDSYLVNDSNYYLSFAYMMAEGASWSLIAQGEIEPNTKMFIEEFGREHLNELGKVGVTLIAYKRDKNFVWKPSIDVQLRIDAVKFYKLHTFRENLFFEQPALLYTLVENDKVARPLVVDAQQLKAEMYANPEAVEPSKTELNTEDLVKRYNTDQSKLHRPKTVKPKDDIIVVDLHADAVLDTTAGMNATDILNYQLDVFRRTLEENKAKKGQKIVFIHGKGEGVLRHAIIHELNYKYKKYPYQDASFQEYGYGATQVTIK